MIESVKLWFRKYLTVSQIINRNARIMLIMNLIKIIEEKSRIDGTKSLTENDQTKSNLEQLVALDQRDLDANVGSALSQWSSFENVIVIIGAALIKIDSEKAGIIFYSIINFGTWLRIISELFAVSSCSKKTISNWNKISEKCRELKDTRDRLAHHTSIDIDRDLLTLPTLASPRLDLRIKSRKYKPLSSVEILLFNEEVAKLMERAGKLLEELVASEFSSSLDKSSQPTVDPPLAKDFR